MTQREGGAIAHQRILTTERIFVDPTPPDVATAFVEALRGAPATTPLVAGARHWELFKRLCERAAARGNLIPDAFLAALAIESGATTWDVDGTYDTVELDTARAPDAPSLEEGVHLYFRR